MWWHTPLIPILRIRGQHSKFQASQSYTVHHTHSLTLYTYHFYRGGHQVEKENNKVGMVAHIFKPSAWEAQADVSLSLRPAWFTKLVLG